MQKGIVGPESMSGIKRLSGNGIKFGKKTYQYEIKVLDKRYGDWIVYGNYDKKSVISYSITLIKVSRG